MMKLFDAIEKSLGEHTEDELLVLLNQMRRSRTMGGAKRKTRSDDDLSKRLLAACKSKGVDINDILKEAGLLK